MRQTGAAGQNADYQFVIVWLACDRFGKPGQAHAGSVKVCTGEDAKLIKRVVYHDSGYR
jgi:hypothetical protein